MKIAKGYAAILMGSMAWAGTMLADSPSPNEIHINGINYGGPGCKQDTVGAYLSEDGKAFTLMFDDYSAVQDRNSSPAEARKSCNINLDLHIPHGWQYTIFAVDYRGYANLDAGLKGTVTSQYRFSGLGASSLPSRLVMQGPVASDYLKKDVVGISSTVWSPCGVSRALNIKTDVRIEGDRRKVGLVTLDTIDGEFSVLYSLQWRRCR